MAALHGAVFLFGVAGLFGKWIALGALLIVFGRVFFATAALGTVLVLRRGFVRPAPREMWLLAGCGALLILHWAAFFHAIQVSTVAVGLLAYSTAPVFAVLLEPWWFREPVSTRSVLASLISLGGVALMIPEWQAGNLIFQGAGWGVVAGGSFAVLAMFNRELGVRIDATNLAFYQDGFATMLLLPVLPFFWRTPAATDLLLLAILGVIFTALAHGLFIEALRHVKARLATLVSNLEPVYGILLAALLLSEIPTPRTVAGGVLILGAVCWVSLRPEHLQAGR
jgi:drug/metabolite transporter (DMT)-like permease